MNEMVNSGQWVAIESLVHRDTPGVRYQMLPAWSFVAIYDEPDGEVPMPDGYDQPGGAAEWCSAHGDNLAVGRRWFYFANRHLDARYHSRHLRATADTPRPISDTYRDIQLDWDHVMQFRDRVLSGAGLELTSSPSRIARVFAREIYANWRGGGPRNHPADVLTHRSWCAGAANTTVAILESLDIPCRLVYTLNHAVCEALLDEVWCVIDSSNHFINHPPGSDCLLPSDFMALTTDPTSEAHGPRISTFHRGMFYRFGPAFYGPPDGRWFNEAQHRLCPAFARTYYPNPTQGAWRFKTADPTRLTILDRSDRVLGGFDWEAGQSLRESVYLGDLEGIRHFEFEIALLPSDGGSPREEDIRQLELRVNNQVVPVLQAWDGCLHPGLYGSQLLNLKLPSQVLCSESVNWLTLRNPSSRSTLRVALNIASLSPYIPPLLHG